MTNKHRTEKVVFLHKNKLNLTHIHLLRHPEHFEELGNFTPLNHLKKWGYVHNNAVTEKGKDLLEEFKGITYNGEFSTRKKVGRKKKEYSKDFLEFWKEFPSTNTYKYGGKSFVGTRTLRVNKDGCQLKYNEALEEFTPHQILHGLKVYLSIMKARSIKENTNTLQYMPNSHRFLNERIFEDYIDLKVVPEPPKEKIKTSFV